MAERWGSVDGSSNPDLDCVLNVLDGPLIFGRESSFFERRKGRSRGCRFTENTDDVALKGSYWRSCGHLGPRME
jgi:hypothetical protein